MNPTSLIPVTQPGNIRHDRVGRLLELVLDGVASDETRRAYSHALEMFLAFCGWEGNPTLSADPVASYRVSLVGEGKASSTVGVHLAAIKALSRAAVMAGLMAAETAASINDVKGAPRRGNRIGNWLTWEQAQGTAVAARPRKPQRQTRLCHSGSPPWLRAATDGTRLRGRGRSHRTA